MIRFAEDEANSPKYAHIERERRWRVDGTQRPVLVAAPSILIEDRYIDGTRMRLRQMTDNASGAVSRKLTKKYETGDPTARPIVTAYLSDAEFALFDQLPCRTITKQRFAIDWDGKQFSLDIFEGALASLELLEIEWPDADGLHSIMPPPWAAYEVSHDPTYQGGSLTVQGIPENF